MFYKGEVPFVRLLIPLSIGIIIAYFFPLSFILMWRIISCFTIFIIFSFLLFRYKSLSLYRYSWLMGIISHVYILISGYGLTVYLSERFDPVHFSSHKAEALVIQVKSEPKLSNGILRFEAEVLRSYQNERLQITKGKLLLATKPDTARSLLLYYGDLLLIPSNYNKIDPPFNPGEFDYKSYLEDRQIYFQLFIAQQHLIVLKRNAGNPVISFALSLRKDLVKKFNSNLTDKSASALASALILGYRADLNKELIEAYSKTGTMHVLSVSGMHVGIVFLVLSVLLKPMGRSKGLIMLRAILIVAIIWFYSLLTGFSAPACRAAFMLSIVVIGKALNKNQNTYNLIAISAFFLLLYNPFYLADVGFQLSYCAVTGLVYFHPKLYQLFFIRNIILDKTWSYCALSIAAQLTTFPISLYYFHQFPVYFLLSNLLIVFPVAFIMYAGITLLFVPFVIIAEPLGQLLNWLINLTNTILYTIENLPFSSLTGIWINTFQYILLYSLLAVFVLWNSFRQKEMVWPAFFLAIVLFMSFSFNSIINYQRHELIFFSLRKNTAMAYLNKGRSIIISDIESSDKLISYSIKPLLESRGNFEFLFYEAGRQLSGENYWTEPNFSQFGDLKIIRWSRNLDNISLSGTVKVNILLLSGNPNQKLQNIRSHIDFETILIDGTNPDYKIEAWMSEAGKMNIPCYSLKKYPAYIVKL